MGGFVTLSTQAGLAPVDHNILLLIFLEAVAVSFMSLEIVFIIANYTELQQVDVVSV